MVVSVKFAVACAAADDIFFIATIPDELPRDAEFTRLYYLCPETEEVWHYRDWPNEQVVSLCLHQQIQRLQGCYGPNRVTNNIRRLGRVKKKCAKQEEAKQIAIETVKNGATFRPATAVLFCWPADDGAGVPRRHLPKGDAA